MTSELLKDCILTAKLTECLKESKSIPDSVNNSCSILLSAVGMLLLIYSILQGTEKINLVLLTFFCYYMKLVIQSYSSYSDIFTVVSYNHL